MNKGVPLRINPLLLITTTSASGEESTQVLAGAGEALALRTAGRKGESSRYFLERNLRVLSTGQGFYFKIPVICIVLEHFPL